MSDAPSSPIPDRTTKIGKDFEPGDTAPLDLEFGVGINNDTDKVVLQFNRMIQWFDLPPKMAIDYAEAIINAAMELQQQIERKKGIIAPKPTTLIGLPKGK